MKKYEQALAPLHAIEFLSEATQFVYQYANDQDSVTLSTFADGSIVVRVRSDEVIRLSKRPGNEVGCWDVELDQRIIDGLYKPRTLFF